jgi:O-antigen/teichoic acid export membrane protein
MCIDARYFLRGGFWLSVGQAATILFGLVTTALLAHYLSENDYGVYKYLLGIIAILSSFSLTGLGQSILQTAAKKYYGFYHETLKMNFRYSLFITLASLAGSVYYWLNANTTLAIGCLLIAALQPFITTYQFTPSHLQGSGRFKESTILHIGRMFFASALTVVTLFYTKNIIVLFTVYLLGQFISNIASHFLFSPTYTKTPKAIFDQYVQYAKHTSVRNIISNIAQRADTVIIFTQLGAVELAVYSIATIIPEQIKGSFKNLSTLLLPKYAEHTNTDQLKKSVPRRSLQLFTILIIITTLYILIAPHIYQLLFPKYSESIFLSQILALSFPAMIALIPISAIQSQLQEKNLYRLLTFESTIMLSLTIILTIKFGVLGTVIAKVATRYISLFYCYRLLYRKLN